MWKSFALKEALNQINKSEPLLKGDLWDFWQLIKIKPEEWHEEKHGKQGDSFWVVAICGGKVIWYNDIEDGFNISTYQKYGYIGECLCNESSLNEIVIQLYNS